MKKIVTRGRENVENIKQREERDEDLIHQFQSKSDATDYDSFPV